MADGRPPGFTQEATNTVIDLVDSKDAPKKALKHAHGIYLPPGNTFLNQEYPGRHHVQVARVDDERVRILKEENKTLSKLDPSRFEPKYRELITDAPELKRKSLDELDSHQECRDLLQSTYLEHELQHKAQEVEHGVDSVQHSALQMIDKLQSQNKKSGETELANQQIMELINQCLRQSAYAELQSYVWSLSQLPVDNKFSPQVINLHVLDILGYFRMEDFSPDPTPMGFLYDLSYRVTHNELMTPMHDQYMLAFCMLTSWRTDILNLFGDDSFDLEKFGGEILDGILLSVKDPNAFLEGLKDSTFQSQIALHLQGETEKLAKIVKSI